MKKRVSLLGVILWAACAGQLSAATLALKVADKEPPKALDPAIAKTLQPKAVQLLDGDKPAYEFWFCKEIPLKTKPASLASALDSVDQATLMGAVSVGVATRDYRDDELPAGVYTMRFALQPQDANHSGSSDFTYFIVLVPAARDAKPDAFTDYRPLVEASRKDTASDHPVILSLRPASAEGSDAPSLQTPAPEHKSLRLKIPAKAGDAKTNLSFELVYEGKVKK